MSAGGKAPLLKCRARRVRQLRVPGLNASFLDGALSPQHEHGRDTPLFLCFPRRGRIVGNDKVTYAARDTLGAWAGRLGDSALIEIVFSSRHQVTLARMVRGTRPTHARGRHGVVTGALRRGSQEHQQQTSHQRQLHDRTSQFGRHLAGTLPQIRSLRQIHLPQQLGVTRLAATLPYGARIGFGGRNLSHVEQAGARRPAPQSPAPGGRALCAQVSPASCAGTRTDPG
jgi:hypothetical protein